jgi:hypothetical protein
MKTTKQVSATPSLWNESEWNKMQQNSAKIPETLEKALLAGYLDEGGDDSVTFCGGLLGHEFIEGTFLLKNDNSDLPDLLLPYRARLEFGKPQTKDDKSKTISAR